MLRRWSVSHLTNVPWKKESSSSSTRGAIVDGLSYQREATSNYERDDVRRNSDPGTEATEPSTSLHRGSFTSSISSVNESSDNTESKPSVSFNTLEKSLHKAVKQNKQSRVLKLLKDGACAQYKSRHGNTPLHTAVVAAVSKLLKARSENDETVEEDSFPVIDLLFSYGCDPFAENQSGKTPLHYAAILRNSSLIKHLLSMAKEASTESRVTVQDWILKTDDKARTAYHYTCMELDDVKEDMIEMMKTCSKKERTKITALLMDSETSADRTKILELLLQFPGQWDSADSSGNTPFKYALKSVEYHTIRLLLRAGADYKISDLVTILPFEFRPESKDHQGISEMSKESFTKTFEDSRDWGLLTHSASKYGYTHLVKYFHECFQEDFLNKPDEFDFIPLHHAVQNNHLDLVKYLLSQKCSLFARTNFKQTPFHLAIESASKDIIEHLLEQSPNSCIKTSIPAVYNECSCRQCLINSQDSKGQTAMHLLSKRSDYNLDILKLLLDNGGSLSIQDAQGRTTVEMFNQKGDTLLTAASKANDAEAIHLLLNLGSNPLTQNKEGYSAIDYAILHHNQEILKLCLFQLRIKNPTGLDQENICKKKTLNETCNYEEKSSTYVNSAELLCKSVQNNLTEISELLLFSGFSSPTSEQTEDNLETALHMTTKKDNLYLMVLLLETGAKVDAANEKGETALHIACNSGNVAAVQLLLQYKADPSMKTLIDSTPENYAVKGDHVKVLEALKTFRKSSDSNASYEDILQASFHGKKGLSTHFEDSLRNDDKKKSQKKSERKTPFARRRSEPPEASVWNKSQVQIQEKSILKEAGNSKMDNQEVKVKVRRRTTDVTAIAHTQGKIDFQVAALKSRYQEQFTKFLKEQRDFLQRKALDLQQKYQEAAGVGNSWKQLIENLETTLDKERRSASNRDIQNKQSQEAMKQKMESLESAVANLTKENSSLKETAALTECRICMDSPCNVVLDPCHHFVLCKGCASKLLECPLCRKRVTNWFTVYT